MSECVWSWLTLQSAPVLVVLGIQVAAGAMFLAGVILWVQQSIRGDRKERQSGNH